MALPSQRTLPLRQSQSTSRTSSTASNPQSHQLQNRIAEKKLELESLRQLRDLSAGLAGQMQQLEEKMSTLSNGTEAVAAVLSNWGSVLRAVHMASVKIPKPAKEDGDEETVDEEVKLPQTLVRIPVEGAGVEARRQGKDGDVCGEGGG